MSLPFNLQKLPPEALDVLRYLHTATAANAAQLEQGTGLSTRLIGKAVRRLVNADYIELSASNYYLTTDGSMAAQQLLTYDQSPQLPKAASELPKVQRHLSVVMMRSFMAGHSGDLYVGINPPEAESDRLQEAAALELRLSAVGGMLSTGSVSLDVPPHQAATPNRIALTPAADSQMVRVKVDAFQLLDSHALEPLGGMYFDVRVSKSPDAVDATLRAVGMDVWLKATP